MKSFLYVIGTDPYKNSHGNYHTRGNGDWHSNATSLDEALKIIFGSMPFPAEPAGRKLFVDGVSLPGINSEEVIQVWSTEPEIVQHTRKILGRRYDGKGLHNGNRRDFGLHAEVKVTDIERYIAPVRKLLAAPVVDADATGMAISPMGASLLEFNNAKYDMQMAVQVEQMELARKQWELESQSESLEDKIKRMQQQIGVMDTYLHGTRHRTQLTSGKQGTGKYSVFQTRVFLSEEVALLANFEDFDWKNMEAFEKWLVKSGQIWKLLPFERCILATRIRKDDKDYGSPLISFFNNPANMQNIVWIRDGENVYHVDVEFNFHNAVFPDRDQFDRAFKICQDYVWSSGFKVKPPTDWRGHALKPGDYDVMGEMRRKPLKEEEPYYTQTIVKERFTTLQAWLDSDCYTDLLHKQMTRAVQDYLQGVNKRQMIFAVLLQGIVDNTNLLDIPRGTDLFNWVNIDDYFTLIMDYSKCLPWSGISDKVAPYLDVNTKPGDWLVAVIEEYIPKEGLYASGTSYKETRPVLVEVVGQEEVEIERMGEPNEHITSKVVKPVIKYHPKVSRRNYNLSYEENLQARTKAPIRLTLKSSKFIKVPMSPSLAEQILDDREWKRKYRWAVPIMVNYKKVIAAVKNPKFTVLKWDNYED